MNQPADRSSTPSRRHFTGKEAESISLREAAKLTEAERRRTPPPKPNEKPEKRAYFFGRRIIERILAQPGCMGLRVYYAYNNETQTRHLVIVGADADQNDQLPPLDAPVHSHLQELPQLPAQLQAADKPVATYYTIAEMAIPCPNQCGGDNLLNGGKS